MATRLLPAQILKEKPDRINKISAQNTRDARKILHFDYFCIEITIARILNNDDGDLDGAHSHALSARAPYDNPSALHAQPGGNTMRLAKFRAEDIFFVCGGRETIRHCRLRAPAKFTHFQNVFVRYFETRCDLNFYFFYSCLGKDAQH